MLKAGGWIISLEDALKWFNAHADFFDPKIMDGHVRSQVVAFWDLRNEAGLPLPFKRIQADFFAYPKVRSLLLSLLYFY